MNEKMIYLFPLSVKKGECDHDTECPDGKACFEHSVEIPANNHIFVDKEQSVKH